MIKSVVGEVDRGGPFDDLTGHIEGGPGGCPRWSGLPFACHSGASPPWNVHAAFAQPGSVLLQKVELPDGARFVFIARTVTAGELRMAPSERARAIALACAEHHAGQLAFQPQFHSRERVEHLIGLAVSGPQPVEHCRREPLHYQEFYVRSHYLRSPYLRSPYLRTKTNIALRIMQVGFIIEQGPDRTTR